MTASQQTFLFAPLKSGEKSVDVPPPRKNLVINAGAGTGKTTAIVGEVLKILLGEPDVSPERIVLMTFTEKAAGEIADRIHAALADLEAHFSDPEVAWPVGSATPLVRVPQEWREAWRLACGKQLESIHLLRSQTIHSFCQSLLRQFPIEAGLDPQFTIIEGFERSLLYSELYDEWIDRETRTDPTDETIDDWRVQMDDTGYLFLVRLRVLGLLDRRDLLQESGINLGDVSDFEPDLLAHVECIRNADLDCISEAAERRTLEHLQRAPLRAGTVDGWIEFFAPVASALASLSLPNIRRHPELNAAVRYIRGENKNHKSIYDRLIAHKAALALVTMTRRFVAFLDEEKRRRGVADFDDLLLRTAALLENPSVLEQARQQYHYLFVDEFQDTDRTQARIIDLLARDASGELVPGKTILVGDPKQSIYGFRRADLETYTTMTAALVLAGAEAKSLQDQYRSDPPLLEAINAIFTEVFPQTVPDPNVARPVYEPLHAAKSKCLRDLDARLTFIAATCDNDDKHLVEAEAIARWILANRDESGTDLRRFALLFRRLTIVDDYLDVFERHGIDYALPPAKLFLERPAPVAMLAVLRAIAYSFDRGAQISAARSIYFALTDEEIVRGILENGELDPESPWAQFAAAIERYREWSRFLTVSQLIDRIIDTTGIAAVYDRLADRPRSMRHLDHLRALSFEYDRRSGGSVRQFVDEIASRRSEPDEMEPLMIDESRNAIRILTVHTSKGLEFETVIIPDLCFANSGSDSALSVIENPPSLVLSNPDSLSGHFRTTPSGLPLKKLRGEREEAEARRLFYVAVTRAKSDVVFVWNSEESVQGRSFAKCLKNAGLDPASLTWPSDGRAVRNVRIGGADIAVALEAGAHDALVVASRARLADRALEESLARSAVVPAAVDVAEEIEKLTPAEAAVARTRVKNRQAGILLHRFLEVWDGRMVTISLLDKLAVESGAAEEIVTKVRRRIDVLSRSAMMRRIADAETIGREMPVRFVDEKGAVVEKRIDRLIVENGREIVIDYKSGTPDPRRLESDRAQVVRYCAAVSAMTGRECSGLLWYIDLEDDRVVDVR